jgi:hypothetical protein
MTNVNYEQAKADQAAAQEKAQRDEVNARAWHQILNKYPLRDTQANYNLVVTWSDPITIESFEALLRRKDNGLDMVSREKLIADIVNNSHGDQNALRQLRFRLGTYSLAQLRQKRRDIDSKAQVHTKEAAKAYVANTREKEIGWRGSGYPKLLSTTVPAGQVHAVPTGQYLRDLAKSDIWLFKRMVKLYSSDQIDYWMNQQ